MIDGVGMFFIASQIIVIIVAILCVIQIKRNSAKMAMRIISNKEKISNKVLLEAVKERMQC